MNMIKMKVTPINLKRRPERSNHEDAVHFGHGGDTILYLLGHPLSIYQNLNTLIIIMPLKSLRKITELPTVSGKE